MSRWLANTPGTLFVVIAVISNFWLRIAEVALHFFSGSGYTRFTWSHEIMRRSPSLAATVLFVAKKFARAACTASQITLETGMQAPKGRERRKAKRGGQKERTELTAQGGVYKLGQPSRKYAQLAWFTFWVVCLVHLIGCFSICTPVRLIVHVPSIYCAWIRR